jgi:TatD DNase family protein
MKLIDSHCHVHFNAYRDDMDNVIQRTLNEGVFLITVGTQKDTSKHGLEVAERYEGVWATVGLHPNHLTAQEFFDEKEFDGGKVKTRSESFDYELYKQMASHPKCVAIGETGLDWYRIPEDLNLDEVKDTQRACVRQHFDLATEMDLPVVIHCRDAYREQAQMIREYVDAGKLSKRGVIHCFTGTEAEARVFIEQGFYISFSGIVTFAKELMEVARALPIEKMLIETDAPYLTPVPHRGKRNEPAFVEHVAKKIAKLKGMSLVEVANITVQNTKDVFDI